MKHLLITGASTGIGYATAKAFLQRGYHVYGSVRKQADVDRLKAELGDNFSPLLFDVTDTAAIAVAVAQVEAEIGKEGLCGLINNAGIATAGPLMLQPLDNLRLQFEVNVIGLIAVTQAFLPLLGAQANPGFPPGRILMISSISGKLSMPFLGAYVGSKHALEGMTGSLRRELLGYGIDVISIGPGAIKTPIWDKSATQALGQYEDSGFGPAVAKVKNFALKSGANGLEADDLAARMLKVFEKKKPKARYTFTRRKFFDYTLPRMLPARMLDRIMKKQMGL